MSEVNGEGEINRRARRTSGGRVWRREKEEAPGREQERMRQRESSGKDGRTESVMCEETRSVRQAWRWHA